MRFTVTNFVVVLGLQTILSSVAGASICQIQAGVALTSAKSVLINQTHIDYSSSKTWVAQVSIDNKISLQNNSGMRDFRSGSMTAEECYQSALKKAGEIPFSLAIEKTNSLLQRLAVARDSKAYGFVYWAFSDDTANFRTGGMVNALTVQFNVPMGSGDLRLDENGRSLIRQ